MEQEQHKSNGGGDAPVFDLKALEGIPVLGPLVGKLTRRGPKIPMIRLSGVIADSAAMRGRGLSYGRVVKMIERAFAVRDAAAVALVINSPGGAPAQAQLIAGLIRSLADEKQITVYAFVEDVAASGGYWLACAADHIYVQETSIIGSIGVVSTGFGFEDFIDRHGIKRRLYTAGRDKSLLDPFLPERAEDVTRLKDIQRDIHRQFIRWVRDRRGGRLEGQDADLFEGRFWTGLTALDYGIADDIGDVRGIMREKYGHDIRLIDFNPEKKRFPLPPGLVGGRGEWPDEILSALENRALWSRLGL